MPKANIWKFSGQNHSRRNVYFHPIFTLIFHWGFYFSLKLVVILILLTLWYDNTMTSPLVAMQYQNDVKKKTRLISIVPCTPPYSWKHTDTQIIHPYVSYIELLFLIYKIKTHVFLFVIKNFFMDSHVHLELWQFHELCNPSSANIDQLLETT